MSEKTGKALAEQQLIEAAPIEPPEAQQEFDFLFDGFQMPKNREQRIKLARDVRKRAVGRPKGSRNKSSLANKEYCQKAGYMSALDIVGSRASMGIAELAAIEGLEMDTAASLWKFCVELYAKYTERPMPQQADVNINEQKLVVVKKYAAEDENGVTIETADFREKSEVQDDDV